MSQVLATVVANAQSGEVFISIQPQAFTPEEAEKLAVQIAEAARKGHAPDDGQRKGGLSSLLKRG